MLKSILNIPFGTALFLVLVLGSCTKASNDPEKEPPVSTAPTYSESFKWTAAGSAEVTADSTHFFSSFTTIYAFKNGNSKTVEINLSALSVGSYSISAVTGNAITYVNGSLTYTASSGTLNISSNADNRLAGSFSVALSGGTVTSLSGQFNDVHKK